MVSAIIDDPAKVYRRALGFYAATTIPATFMGVLFANYFLVYATDVLLMAPALVGTLIAIARVYDGVSDIAIATWSDRATFKSGRRRPFIIAAGILYLFMVMLWLQPDGLSAAEQTLWLLFALIIYQTAATCRHIPLRAIGIEAGDAPAKRTWFLLAIALLTMPFIVYANFLGQQIINAPDPQAAITPWAIGSAVLFCGLTILGYPFLKELPANHRTVERNVLTMMKEVLGVGYHRKLIAVQIAEAFAFTSLAFSVTYVMIYVLDEPTRIAVIFVAYMVVQRISGLGWLWLIRRIGMKQVWINGLYIWLVVFALVPFILVAGLPLYITLAVLAGIAGGAAHVNYAMLGDVADYDAKHSGRQRQGIYMTIYNLVSNAGGAATAFILGWLLQFAGYVPNAEQGDMTIAAIIACSSVIPFIGVVIGVRILKSYDLYEREGVSDGRHTEEASATFSRPERLPA